MPQPTDLIPVPSSVPTWFMIFCRFSGAPPSVSDIFEEAKRWVMDNVHPPLREMIWAYLNPELMIVDVAPRRDVPIEILRQCAPMLSEEQRQEIDAATHVISVRASDPLPGPRLGLFAAVAAAKACAERSGARVALDADTASAFPLSTPFHGLHSGVEPCLASFIRCPYSFGDNGVAYMTTIGMARFGLPDLQVIGIPPIDIQALGRTLIGLCQVLITMIRSADGGYENPAAPVPAILETAVTEFYLQMSGARMADTPAVSKDAVARVRLEYQPQPGNPERSFFTLRPPAGYSGDYGAWLHSLVNTFFAPEDTMHNVVHGSGMEQAHRRAIAELPSMKQRYLSGALGPWRFGVKHGFTVGDPRDGNHEYMWVFVREWVGNRIAGELVNSPRMRKDLRMGQRIELTEADVFDWIVVGPNGPQEGAYTDRDFS
jgi:uncharacterized protein YegJ (DUF2314 family)